MPLWLVQAFLDTLCGGSEVTRAAALAKGISVTADQRTQMVVTEHFVVDFWVRAVLLVYKHTADDKREALLLTATFERCSLESKVFFLQICPVLSFQ